MKNAAIVLAAVSFLFAAGVLTSQAQDIDVTAPNFTLKDLQGNLLSLADYQGKVLFLNFWATWCPPCRAEIPDFIDAYDAYNNKGLEILGISVDRVAPDKLLAFVNKAKISYPIVLGDREIVDTYKPGQYIPATIVIDKKGIIRHREIGQMEKETLIKLFEKYNNEDK